MNFQSISLGQNSDLNCNFETDLCEWKDFSTSGIIWKRDKTTNNNKPGSFPVGDHSIGQNGFYVYTGNSSNANFYSKVIELFSIYLTFG